MLEDLWHHNVRLMVEDRDAHMEFLEAYPVDEVQLTVAPLFRRDSSAPTFVSSSNFLDGHRRPGQLAEVPIVEDVATLRYNQACG